MRGLVLGAVLAAVAAITIAVWSPIAGSQTADVRVTCKTRGIDVYFWPKGHPFVKTYKFPKYGPPHLEVYKKGLPASKDFLIFLSATSYNYANTCTLATNPLPTRWGGGPRATVSATRRARCTFPVIVQIKIIPQGGPAGGGLRVLKGGSPTEFLRATITGKRSTLTYDTRYCKATVVPGVK